MNHHDIGKLITTPQERDAIHVAVVPVTAMERLRPGDFAKVEPGTYNVKAATKYDFTGVVDPFLKDPEVMPGQSFWLFLPPGSIITPADVRPKCIECERPAEHAVYRAGGPVPVCIQHCYGSTLYDLSRLTKPARPKCEAFEKCKKYYSGINEDFGIVGNTLLAIIDKLEERKP